MIKMNIEQYISLHSSPEDDLLAELNRETNLKVLMPRMLSGHIQGKFLEFVSKMIQPKTILELGTYTGYSAICLAKGLSSSGILHTIEINDELEPMILKYIEKAHLKDKIKLYIGDALELIPQLDIKPDLVFIDADKRLYPQYLDLIVDILTPGGFILSDNVLWGNKVVESLKTNDLYTKGILEFNKKVIQNEQLENFILPIRDGISVIRKKVN